MAVTKQLFGKAADGSDLTLYTLDNGHMQVKVTDLGATIQSIIVQDKNENMIDVALGYDTPEGYYEGTCYFGAVIGRSGNRIDKGRFTINGKEYQLDINDNENNLHSGLNGFDKRKWEVSEVSGSSVTFSLKDGDLEQGYPGNFSCSVTYTLTDEDTLRLHYKGVCDQDTIANMTNHTYFNLGGHKSGSIEGHELMLAAKHYTPVIDHQAIPTGECAPVEGTVFDFTTAKEIGRDIEADVDQLKFVKGYDHNFIIREKKGPVIKVAEAYCKETGICMETYTDLPCIQFYAGNCMTPDQAGKDGAVYQPRHGFCLETQYAPNAINMEGFDKPLLKAGESYDTVTCYKFFGR